jgi:hypothetical protein
MDTVRQDIFRLLAVIVLLFAAVLSRADDDLSMEAGGPVAPLEDEMMNLGSTDETPITPPAETEPLAQEAAPAPAAQPEPLPPEPVAPARPSPRRKVATEEFEYVEREKVRLWHNHFALTQFDLAFSGAGEGRAGATILAGGMVAWRPTLQLARRVQLRGLVGLHMLKDYKSSAAFVQVMDFEGFVALAADGGYIELGGGMQSWQDAGSGAAISVNLAAPFRRDHWFFLDRFFVGYTAYLGSPVVHQGRMGFGLAFF